MLATLLSKRSFYKPSIIAFLSINANKRFLEKVKDS
jgi:hypothetical protein